MDILRLIVIVLGVGTVVGCSYILQKWSGWRDRVLHVASTTLLVQAPRFAISGVAVAVGVRFLFKLGGKQERFPDSLKLLLGLVLIIGGSMTLSAVLSKSLPFLVGGLGILTAAALVTGISVIIISPDLDGAVFAVGSVCSATITGIDRFLVNSADLLTKEVAEAARTIERLAGGDKDRRERDE